MVAVVLRLHLSTHLENLQRQTEEMKLAGCLMMIGDIEYQRIAGQIEWLGTVGEAGEWQRTAGEWQSRAGERLRMVAEWLRVAEDGS